MHKIGLLYIFNLKNMIKILTYLFLSLNFVKLCFWLIDKHKVRPQYIGNFFNNNRLNLNSERSMTVVNNESIMKYILKV